MLRGSRRNWWSVVAAVAAALGLMLSTAVPPTQGQGNPNPGIAPIQSKPHGKSYSEWAAEWWQWALETPAGDNPVLDRTGEHCAEGQTGRVWFLAGSFGTDPVERSCVVPTGTAMFFPLINSFYGAFLNDPPETRTEAYLRAQVACELLGLSVEIDGVPVNDPSRYFEQSPLFDVQLPEDNVFGLGEDVVPGLLLSPVVDEGYYLFLKPLPPGEHTIHWMASLLCPFGSGTQEVTYHLRVRSGRSHHKGETQQALELKVSPILKRSQ